MMKQRELTTKIVNGIGEINFAVERFERRKKESMEKEKEILDSKLKMKGFKLLKG